MKKLLSILFLSAILVANVKGQATTTVAITAGTNSVLAAPYHLLSISALGTAAQTVNFYDAAGTDLSITNAPYVSFASYTTNVTNIDIATTTGIPQTNVFTGIWTYAVTNAAATNRLPIVQTLILAANIPVTVPANARLLRGLAAVTTNSATVSVVYKANIGQ